MEEKDNPTGQQFISYQQPVVAKHKDDISDLFEVTDEDVIGDDKEGFEDLVLVTEEDVMGHELYGESPLDNSDMQKRQQIQQVRKPVYRIAQPPPQIGGLR